MPSAGRLTFELSASSGETLAVAPGAQWETL